ncbi:transglycosylase SLT domain-containing protein [Kitasatospora sp. NBC_00315]|uniref:transglycosylase SLT domain-containing protein n=1 Tax=Kitasatospora sp. NBC_00315 TaxID=2975963 RepID=UPI00324746C2
MKVFKGSTVLATTVVLSAALLTSCGTKPAHDASAPPPATAAGTSPAASPSPSDSPPAAASESPSASPSPSAKTSTAAASKPASARPSTQAAKTTPKPVAAAAPAPVAKPGPVAPPPPAPTTPHVPPLESSCKPSYPRPNEPRSTVGAALTAAAAQSRVLSLSNGGTDRMPPLPTSLVRAIAWQESGWQSGILACDGGIGTMQVMPATVAWMNGKYAAKSDPETLEGNVQLGTQLIDWLIAYYGDSSFGGKYDLTPDPATGKTPLLDLVIAAYNAGAGNVHYNSVTDPVTNTTTGSLVIPNPGYVANVKALMSSAPWNAG